MGKKEKEVFLADLMADLMAKLDPYFSRQPLNKLTMSSREPGQSVAQLPAVLAARPVAQSLAPCSARALAPRLALASAPS